MKKLTATVIAALALAGASTAGQSFGDCPSNAVCGIEIAP